MPAFPTRGLPKTLIKRLLTLSFAGLALMAIVIVPHAHASTGYSVNIFANSGFENPPGFPNATAPGWGREFFDSNVGSETGVDCTKAVAGNCSARLDIGQSDIRLSNTSQTITFGHTSLYQILPVNTYFDNLSDRPDGLNVWLYIQPKFTDYPLVQVRFKAQSTIEMDYVLINVPLLGTGSSNSTNGGEAGKAIKSFVIPNTVLNQWNHLERDVKRDWVSPMRLSNGTMSPGFLLNDTIFRVEIEAYYYKDTASGKVYGETVWADEVRLYADTGSQPQPPEPPNPTPYRALSFQDVTGTPLDNIITTAVFNSLGLQVSPAVGELIPATGYTLRVFYAGQIIWTSPIPSSASSPVLLPMYPLNSPRTSFVAFNSTVSSLNLIENGSDKISFSAQGTGPTFILVNVPTKPLIIDRDASSISTWTYNATQGIVEIQTTSLGTFSILFTNPQPPIPPATSILPLIIGAIAITAIIAVGLLFWRSKTFARKTDPRSETGDQPSKDQSKAKQDNSTKARTRPR